MIDSTDQRWSLKLARVVLRVLSYVMPPLFWRISAKLFFYHKRPSLREQDKARLNEARQLISPKWMMAWQFGDHRAPAVVLLHGWAMRGAHMLPYVQPLLDKGYRVIIIDLPGHGASAGNTTNPQHSAKFLHPWLAAQDNIYGIIGHSYGGVLGLRASYALGTTQRLACIATPQRYIYPEFAQHLRFNARMERQFKARAKQQFGIDILAMHARDIPADYATQVRFVHGEKDTVVALSQPTELADMLPNADIKLVAGGDHLKIIWHQDAIQHCMDVFPVQHPEHIPGQ